jgi:hypothetical protein
MPGDHAAVLCAKPCRPPPSRPPLFFPDILIQTTTICRWPLSGRGCCSPHIQSQVMQSQLTQHAERKWTPHAGCGCCRSSESHGRGPQPASSPSSWCWRQPPVTLWVPERLKTSRHLTSAKPPPPEHTHGAAHALNLNSPGKALTSGAATAGVWLLCHHVPSSHSCCTSTACLPQRSSPGFLSVQGAEPCRGLGACCKASCAC